MPFQRQKQQQRAAAVAAPAAAAEEAGLVGCADGGSSGSSGVLLRRGGPLSEYVALAEYVPLSGTHSECVPLREGLREGLWGGGWVGGTVGVGGEWVGLREHSGTLRSRATHSAAPGNTFCGMPPGVLMRSASKERMDGEHAGGLVQHAGGLVRVSPCGN
jgi:hypothetical protein